MKQNGRCPKCRVCRSVNVDWLDRLARRAHIDGMRGRISKRKIAEPSAEMGGMKRDESRLPPVPAGAEENGRRGIPFSFSGAGDSTYTVFPDGTYTISRGLPGVGLNNRQTRILVWLRAGLANRDVRRISYGEFIDDEEHVPTIGFKIEWEESNNPEVWCLYKQTLNELPRVKQFLIEHAEIVRDDSAYYGFKDPSPSGPADSSHQSRPGMGGAMSPRQAALAISAAGMLSNTGEEISFLETRELERAINTTAEFRRWVLDAEAGARGVALRDAARVARLCETEGKRLRKKVPHLGELAGLVRDIVTAITNEDRRSITLLVRKSKTHYFWRLAFFERSLGASITPVYNRRVEETAEFYAVAAQEGISPVRLRAIIDKEKAAKGEITARETKARATAQTRPTDLTTARMMAAYEVLVRESDLLNPELSEPEQLRRAGNLISTYNRLRKHDPKFHDNNDQLRAARRIRMAHFRQSKRAKREARQTAHI
jgi:hypothetical protein